MTAARIARQCCGKKEGIMAQKKRKLPKVMTNRTSRGCVETVKDLARIWERAKHGKSSIIRADTALLTRYLIIEMRKK